MCDICTNIGDAGLECVAKQGNKYIVNKTKLDITKRRQKELDKLVKKDGCCYAFEWDEKK